MAADSLSSLVENRLSPGAWTGFDLRDEPKNEHDAYQKQFKLHDALTRAGFGPRVGWKIGCTTPVMQKFMSIDHPCSGGIMENSVHLDHLEIPYKNSNRVGVECEIAVTLSDDLPAKQSAYTVEEVSSAIASCRAAMEIVDDRYEDFSQLSTEAMIVDDFFQSACVLGAEVFDLQSIDLAFVSGRTIINGRDVGRGLGSDVMGHPLNALSWLANNLIGLGRHLKAGEFVLLGSMVECQWLAPGDEVKMEMKPLGGVSAKFPDR